MPKVGNRSLFIVVTPCNGYELNNVSLIFSEYSLKAVMTILGVESETVANPTDDTDVSGVELGEFCVDYQMKA